MFRPARTVVVAAALGMLLAGCGGDQDMSASAASTLQQDVQAVVEAAEASQWDAAAAALHELTRDVATAQAAGELSAERAERILAAAQRVSEDLEQMPEPDPPAVPEADEADEDAAEEEPPSRPEPQERDDEEEEEREEEREERKDDKGKKKDEDKKGEGGKDDD